MTPFLIITIAVLLLWAGIFLVYRHEVARAFVEPALRFPLLIFESDDWGPGPRSDADVLLRLGIVTHLSGGFHHDTLSPVHGRQCGIEQQVCLQAFAVVGFRHIASRPRRGESG